MIHVTFLQHELSTDSIGGGFFDLLQKSVSAETRRELKVLVVGGGLDQVRAKNHDEGDQHILLIE
jgi:hypothetical protein